MRVGVGQVGRRMGGEGMRREVGSRDIWMKWLLYVGMVSNKGVGRMWVLLIGLETVVEEVGHGSLCRGRVVGKHGLLVWDGVVTLQRDL